MTSKGVLIHINRKKRQSFGLLKKTKSEHFPELLLLDRIQLRIIKLNDKCVLIGDNKNTKEMRCRVVWVELTRQKGNVMQSR